LNDQEILQQLSQGQSAGLEKLFKKYYRFLTNIAFYITKNKAVAEDITQELFAKLWEQRERLEQVEHPKAYLSTAIRNSAMNYLQSQKTAQSQLGDYLQIQQEYYQDTLQEWEVANQIAASLEKLPPRCRLIFSLNRFEGLTNEEIADYLGLSKRTVETQISKALKILRIELKDALNRCLQLLIF